MEGKEELVSVKRGYLKKDFQFFHLKDQKNMEFEFHYHEFHKILIFISGKVNYYIEGKAYRLKPWDILFISNDEIHKPVVDGSEVYERIILWIDTPFLEKHNKPDCNLLTCFQLASMQKYHLLRMNGEFLKEIKSIISQMEAAFIGTDFGEEILKNALFIQLMVYFNRLFIKKEEPRERKDIEYDENIEKIIDFINKHIHEELTIEELSEKFYMSKYYLMHKFKKHTGYTIHNYIMQKRLLYANALIKKGRSIMEACVECGFSDYSNFVRAFKKMFGASPKKHYKALLEIEKGSNSHF